MAARIPLSSVELGYVECGNGSRADYLGYLHAGDTDISIDGTGAADLADDIFRACAAHDALVAALKQAIAFAEADVALADGQEVESVSSCDLGADGQLRTFDIVAARAAIAKAEVQS